MPYGNNFLIPVQPGRTITLKFAFSARWENLIEVYDQHNTLVITVNNYPARVYQDAHLTNNTGNPINYRVWGRHKQSDPNPGFPWLNSAGYLENVNGGIRIGFDDQLDDNLLEDEYRRPTQVNYRNAVVEITYN